VHISPSKSITVAAAAERWIKLVETKGWDRATVRQHRQDVDLHIVPRIGRIKLAQVSPARVEAFRDDLLDACPKQSGHRDGDGLSITSTSLRRD